MVKNIVGLRVQMELDGQTPRKIWHMQVPKKVIVRRFRQFMEDIEGAPTGAYNVYNEAGTISLNLNQTINQQMASHGHANGVDISILLKDE